MISTLAAACVIFLAFRKLMQVILGHDVEWDVPPLLLFWLTVMSAVQMRSMIHRRLT